MLPFVFVIREELWDVSLYMVMPRMENAHVYTEFGKTCDNVAVILMQTITIYTVAKEFKWTQNGIPIPYLEIGL